MWEGTPAVLQEPGMKVARRPNGPDQAALCLASPGKWAQQPPVVPTPEPVPGLNPAVGCPQLAQGYGVVVAE